MADVLARLEDGSLAAVDGGLLAEKVESAVSLLDRTLDLYGPSRVALSFNGGKDSTVLLHLLRAAVERRRRRRRSDNEAEREKEKEEEEEEEGEKEEQGDGNKHGDLDGVRSFTFERDDDFPEIAQFVCQADAEHGLRLERITSPNKNKDGSSSSSASGTGSSGAGSAGSSRDLVGALASYLARSGVAAVVLGTRRGDPNAGGQDALCASSPGWPPFLRVNPVLEWGYADVWGFLDAVGARYCALYDRGFTSVGAAPSTSPNPALRRPDGSYAPARELSDGRTERAGRERKGGGGGGKGKEEAGAKEEAEEAGAEEAAEEAGRQRPHLPPPASPPPPLAPSSSSTTPSLLAPSAAIVLVGDELLSGRVADANGLWLCRRLREAGWLPRRLAVVPDDAAAIASEVSAAARAHPAVLVAGGVGPTDDDVTAAGVAEALRVPLARDPDLAERLRSHFGTRLLPAHLKMADAPARGLTALDVFQSDGDGDGDGDVDVDGDAKRTRSPFPLLAVACSSTGSTVFILPGVPHLLRRKWPALEAHLGTLPAAGGGGGGGGGKKSSSGGEDEEAAAAAAAAAAAPAANGTDGRAKKLSPFHAAALRLLLDDETAAAPAMAAASAAGGAIVSVGSYPLAAASCDDGWGRRRGGQGRGRESETDTDTPRKGDGATVCLLLESKDAAALSAAVEAAIGALPAEALVAAERDPEGLGGGGAEQAR